MSDRATLLMARWKDVQVEHVKLLRKRSLQHRIKMLPKTAAARHHVLPEPRLAFMDAGRDTSAERRAIERSADSLLVHGVAGLVQCREQRVAKVVLVDAGGDADVASRKSSAERMVGEVEPSALKYVAETFRNTQGKLELGCFGESLP